MDMRIGLCTIEDYRGRLDREVARLIPLNREFSYREIEWLKKVAHCLRKCNLQEFTAAALYCLSKVACASHVKQVALVNFVAIHHPNIENSQVLSVFQTVVQNNLISSELPEQGVSLTSAGLQLLKDFPPFERIIMRLSCRVFTQPRRNKQDREVLNPLTAADKSRFSAQNGTKGSCPTTHQQEAVDILLGKGRILETLKQPEENWPYILRLNKLFDGPIKTRSGAKPFAVTLALINWWNLLELRFQETEARQKDKAAVGSGNYTAGRTEMAPDVGGRVKKRRKPRKA